MAFLQSCLIRKNTKEIIDTLIEIGYDKPNEYRNIFTNLLTVPSRNGKGSLIALTDKCADLLLINNGFKTIDCGTNEDLFLALASLKDDNDKNQWFIYDGNNPKDYYIQNGDWYMCIFEHNIPNGHKATVEEILKHFK
jgi:hypothetical protein